MLRDEIEQLAAYYPKYGYRHITHLLLRMGYSVGYTRVARLMRKENLLVAVKRACQTTQSLRGHSHWDKGISMGFLSHSLFARLIPPYSVG